MGPKDCGIFPAVEHETDDPDALEIAQEDFCCSDAGHDGLANVKFDEFVRTGHVREFSSYAELVAYLEVETPVLPKVHILTKTKPGRTKHRLILDCRKAGLTRSPRRGERLILPRVADAVTDFMDLSGTEAALALALLVMFGVLDSTDAYWMIPLHKKERRYFTTRIRQRYFVFLRTAQDSRGVPLTWSRFGALLARLLQGVIEVAAARPNLYVDDTLAFLEILESNTSEFAVVVYIWMASGLPLALRKAVFGTQATWTLADAIQEGFELTCDYLGKNVILVTDPRAYVGNCMAIANSVIYTWTPFWRPLWAAIPLESSPPITRIKLRVRSDSLVALHSLVTVKAAGKGPAIIGRELALDIARGSYQPDVAAHLPGVANSGPDCLFRLDSPSSDGGLPAYLLGVMLTPVPPRDAEFFRASSPPSILSATHLGGTGQDNNAKGVFLTCNEKS